MSHRLVLPASTAKRGEAACRSHRGPLHSEQESFWSDYCLGYQDDYIYVQLRKKSFPRLGFLGPLALKMWMSPCLPAASPGGIRVCLLCCRGGMCPSIHQCFGAMDFGKSGRNVAWHPGDTPLLKGSWTGRAFVNQAGIKPVRLAQICCNWGVRRGGVSSV